MTKNEKRFLARHVCGWCDQPIDKDWCGAIWDKCSEETRAKRREECLKSYKPRKRVTASKELQGKALALVSVRAQGRAA